MTTDDSHISAHTANIVCPIKSQLIHLKQVDKPPLELYGIHPPVGWERT